LGHANWHDHMMVYQFLDFVTIRTFHLYRSITIHTDLNREQFMTAVSTESFHLENLLIIMRLKKPDIFFINRLFKKKFKFLIFFLFQKIPNHVKCNKRYEARCKTCHANTEIAHTYEKRFYNCMSMERLIKANKLLWTKPHQK
jgi:hypothetical protein